MLTANKGEEKLKQIIKGRSLPLILAVTHPDRFYAKGDPGLTDSGIMSLEEILSPLSIIIGTNFLHFAHGTGARFMAVYKLFQEHFYGTVGATTRTASPYLGTSDANLEGKSDRMLATGDLIPANEYLGLTKAECFSPWIHLWELLKKAVSNHARVLLILTGGEFMFHLLRDAKLIKELRPEQGQVYEIDFIRQMVRLTELSNPPA